MIEHHRGHPDFGNYQHVPDAWILTRNTIVVHGNVEQWNLEEFRSVFTGKDDIRTSWRRRGLDQPRTESSPLNIRYTH